MQCLLNFLGKKEKLPYSCTTVKFYKLKSSHQITWCKTYWVPAMGELRRSPETLNCTSSVTGFCPLSTDYKYSVLESCLFTNVIEFPEIKKKVLKCTRVLRCQATKESQWFSHGILNVKQFKAEHLHANISVFQNLFRSYSTTMLSVTWFSTSLLPNLCWFYYAHQKPVIKIIPLYFCVLPTQKAIKTGTSELILPCKTLVIFSRQHYTSH